MRNGRTIHEVWESFCAHHGLVLEQRYRNYVRGKTIIHSTKEMGADYEIEYSHRYELPDTGARPEELAVRFTSTTKNFRAINVSRASFLSRLLGSEKLNVKSSGSMSSQTLNQMHKLLMNYDLQAIEGKESTVYITFGEFPNSANNFDELRIQILELVKGLVEQR